jgi:segregation and condensation protein A
MEVVARFLALLELYREATVLFEQEDPLGDLRVTWTGGSLQEATEAAEADRARARAEEEEYG